MTTSPSSPDTTLRLAKTDDLERLEPHWRHLYELQREGGMDLPLPENGFALWSQSLATVLGRFGCVVLAETVSGEIAGFVAGRVRTAPPWFGGEPVGFVSEVYVAPTARGQGLAERMLGEAAAWFGAQGIERLELQVLTTNQGARRVYERLGWREELVQMVLRPGGS